MSWNISELDKNKTEQCISNESVRLDTCRETLDKLKREYNHMCIRHNKEKWKFGAKMLNLQKSIESGEKFINECKEHLKDFENAETN